MKATKKLIGAVVALIAALAVSVGATFAWFTTQNTAKVESFDLTVQSETGNLYIGTTKDTLGQIPVTVTPDGGITLKDLTLKENKLQKRTSSAPGSTADAEASKSTDYYQFELWFQATTNMDVYLDTSSVMSCTPNAANDITVTDATAQAAMKLISYGAEIKSGKLATSADAAARVAFVEGQISSLEDLTGAKIWEPGKDKGYKENNLAADYEKYLQDGTWPAEGAKSAPSTVVGTITGLGTGEETAKLLTLSANEAKSIVVTIWLEGTDGDCLNSIFSDTISTVLNFVGQSTGA